MHGGYEMPSEMLQGSTKLARQGTSVLTSQHAFRLPLKEGEGKWKGSLFCISGPLFSPLPKPCKLQ